MVQPEVCRTTLERTNINRIAEPFFEAMRLRVMKTMMKCPIAGMECFVRVSLMNRILVGLYRETMF